ncbi:MAG: beta-galactosidase/beta-glucuronidase [Kiritimatiellia bacterium]|jgi:beta-galactosidase/beta-glucuronidase
MSKNIPRPEHPRPQFVREPWINLNGPWTYCFDVGKSGMDASRALFNSQGFDEAITVPFCPESELSGVGHTDFIEAMWYHREVSIPADWDGRRVLLHFGGVDYESEVFIDGKSALLHVGGSASFTVDITRFVSAGKSHHLVVRVKDELRHPDGQARGKQCDQFKSVECSYTRTTGIWQTVWLEGAHPQGLQDVHVVPDLDGKRFVVTPRFWADPCELTFNVEVRAEGRVVAKASAVALQGGGLALDLSESRPWSPSDPFLYGISYTLTSADGTVVESVDSYAGLRKVHIEGQRVYLNNEPLYQRLVLDQGFYPDGIWTAPNDAALKRDILLSMEAGFNGARLHQKVFEERFHYWADKLGYLTWGEYCSWGCDPNKPAPTGKMLAEWRSIVVRDRNHPSIIAWTPFNETRSVSDVAEHTRAHIEAYALTKDLDPTRPVNDASGYIHRMTDLWTVHNYDQNPDILKEKLTPGEDTGVLRNFPKFEVDYTGQPYLVDEFGGIKWIPPSSEAFADNSWGYGDAPQTLDAFYARLEGLVNVLLSFDHISGYCYTQLTDVEQEQNGIYNYDRSAKFDIERIRAIFSRQP